MPFQISSDGTSDLPQVPMARHRRDAIAKWRKPSLMGLSYTPVNMRLTYRQHICKLQQVDRVHIDGDLDCRPNGRGGPQTTK